MRRFSLLLAAALAAALAVVGGVPLSYAAERGGPTRVRVLVVTMFGGETAPWLKNRSLPVPVRVDGVPDPLHCDRAGLCVVTTGQGKANTAATMTAVLTSRRLDLRGAYFITAGIAGTSPKTGTLGFAAWAHYIVDYDLGHHLPPEEAPSHPYGFVQLGNVGTNVFQLDDALVDTAYRLTKDMTLTDTPTAAAERAHYPGQAGTLPKVAVCDTVTGDNWWAGKTLSEKAQYITGLWTKGKGTYCTTQMEDNATAAVLARFGRLDHYLNLRTASNFDQPYPGQTLEQHLASNSGAFGTSTQNAYLVASKVADHLLRRGH
ncbi:Purine nucleoside permease (NUP) [Actinomadura rubteroloni]|uniref:Purine nucleoside permease (NUP) n=1 Tax=Actinomadura rubteroloni TaxID=1926885 RepID=A0A2P4UQV6_9ACTN|nr:purine nucleoside permease [Actinomadura rubteroloni]POM27421.1 Purine nucleoside permease (NUP) [Actinomadura rubteroloni]